MADAAVGTPGTLLFNFCFDFLVFLFNIKVISLVGHNKQFEDVILGN